MLPTTRPSEARDGAGRGGRTHTRLAANRILSPARLPVPPFRLGGVAIQYTGVSSAHDRGPQRPQDTMMKTLHLITLAAALAASIAAAQPAPTPVGRYIATLPAADSPGRAL